MKNLEKPINNLRDILKKNAGRIIRENTERHLYSDFDKYILNNENSNLHKIIPEIYELYDYGYLFNSSYNNLTDYTLSEIIITINTMIFY